MASFENIRTPNYLLPLPGTSWECGTPRRVLSVTSSTLPRWRSRGRALCCACQCAQGGWCRWESWSCLVLRPNIRQWISSGRTDVRYIDSWTCRWRCRRTTELVAHLIPLSPFPGSTPAFYQVFRILTWIMIKQGICSHRWVAWTSRGEEQIGRKYPSK